MVPDLVGRLGLPGLMTLVAHMQECWLAYLFLASVIWSFNRFFADFVCVFVCVRFCRLYCSGSACCIFGFWYLILLVRFWLTWKMWVYAPISVSPAGWLAGWRSVHMWLKLQGCDFLEHHEYDKCQTLHDGSTHWALTIHTTFSEFDCISRSQQCQTALPENVMYCAD